MVRSGSSMERPICCPRLRCHSHAALFVLVLRLFCAARCYGGVYVYPTSAFGHRSNGPRGRGRILARHNDFQNEETTKYEAITSSETCYRNGKGKWQVADLSDRRSCLAHLTTFGAGALMNAGSASAKESRKNNLGNDLLETLTSPPKYDSRHPNAAVEDAAPVTITLPLEPASGGTFCVRLTVFASDEKTSSGQGFGGRRRTDLDESFHVYRAIVDTGSPYLVLPSSPGQEENYTPNVIQLAKAALASTQETAENAPLRLSPSEYPPTEEIYGAVKGQINWKLARYSFRDPRLQTLSPRNGNEGTGQSSTISLSSANNNVQAADKGVVGVLDDALTNEATGGGMLKPYALLGLIQNSNPDADKSRFPDPRPSFLEQERITSQTGYDENDNDMMATENAEYVIKSFSINGPQRELTLSTKSMIPATIPAMKLVDLRTVGDFVDHYAVVVNSVAFDGISVSSKSLKEFSGNSIERPIVAVFDTGLTGCLLIRPFWDILQNYMGARKDGAVDEFRSVSLSSREESRGQQMMRKNSGSVSSMCIIQSSFEEDPRGFYVQPIDLDWFDNELYSPYVIVLGQTFLRQGALTIDVGERIATFDVKLHKC